MECKICFYYKKSTFVSFLQKSVEKIITILRTRVKIEEKEFLKKQYFFIKKKYFFFSKTGPPL